MNLKIQPFVMCVTLKHVFTRKQKKNNKTLKCDTENLDVLSLGIGYKDTSNLLKFLVSGQSGAWLGLRMDCLSVVNGVLIHCKLLCPFSALFCCNNFASFFGFYSILSILFYSSPSDGIIGLPPTLNSLVHIIHRGGVMRVKCCAQEHKAVTLARDWTLTTWSGVEFSDL